MADARVPERRGQPDSLDLSADAANVPTFGIAADLGCGQGSTRRTDYTRGEIVDCLWIVQSRRSDGSHVRVVTILPFDARRSRTWPRTKQKVQL